MFERISQEHPVIVLGLGLTGASCVNYCQRKGWPVLVMDSREQPPQLNEFKAKSPDVTIICGDFDAQKLAGAGLIIISPGIDFHHPSLELARHNHVPIVGDVELFSIDNQVPVIAVTGSNGKSTVCDCLGWMFNQLGVNTVVAGNIGTPVLDLLQYEKPELYVLELSSFQLETLHSLKAQVVSVLNISEDHLDRHGTMENYAAIKRRIYLMGKSAAINTDDALTHDDTIPLSRVSFGTEPSAEFSVTNDERGFAICRNNVHLLSETDCHVNGLHNGLNLAACLAIAHLFGIEINETVLTILKQYSGLEYRCQLVDSIDSIRWINDSKATNVGAAKAAIQSFSGQSKHLYLIAGGDAKGGNIAELKAEIEKHITYTWVYGKDAVLFLRELPQSSCLQVKDLTEAVSRVKEIAVAGDTVLFSPACASTDMYPNYKVRGEHFNQLVGGAR